jgi:hypothetical protein
MTENQITPEELRRLVSARDDEQTVRDALSMAAATIEARQAERDGLASTLEQVRAILDDEPECAEHPDSDPVTCGWKYDIRRIRGVMEEASNE